MAFDFESYDPRPGSADTRREIVGFRHVADQLNRAFNQQLQPNRAFDQQLFDQQLQPSRLHMSERDYEDVARWTMDQAEELETVPIEEVLEEPPVSYSKDAWDDLMAAEVRFLQAHGWEVFVLPPGTRDTGEGPPYWRKDGCGPSGGFASQSQAVSNQKKMNLREGARVPIPGATPAAVSSRFSRLEKDDAVDP